MFGWNELKIYYGIKNPESRWNVVSSLVEGCSIKTSQYCWWKPVFYCEQLLMCLKKTPKVNMNNTGFLWPIPIFSFFQTHKHKQISIKLVMCSDLCTCLKSTRMCLDQLVVVFVISQVTNRGVPSGGLTTQCNHTITCLKVLLLSLYFLKFNSSTNMNTDTHSK